MALEFGLFRYNSEIRTSIAGPFYDEFPEWVKDFGWSVLPWHLYATNISSVTPLSASIIISRLKATPQDKEIFDNVSKWIEKITDGKHSYHDLLRLFMGYQTNVQTKSDTKHYSEYVYNSWVHDIRKKNIELPEGVSLSFVSRSAFAKARIKELHEYDRLTNASDNHYSENHFKYVPERDLLAQIKENTIQQVKDEEIKTIADRKAKKLAKETSNALSESNQ